MASDSSMIDNKQSLLASNPVWVFFDQITKIPRPSKHEERIVAFLLDFAAQRGLEARRDKVGDVLIKVPATAGREAAEPVILQAHVDMVCEKNSDCGINFLTDPIDYYVKGGWVRAKGTTLGADDGIGVALALAIVDGGLKGEIEHGPLFCLFTVDEETGLTGAYNVTADFLPANRLINLDSEDEGQIFIGCAGGCTTRASFPIQRVSTPDGFLGLSFSLSGLLGGHSGGDIHLGRANANKLMARFLRLAQEKYGLRLASLNGGNLHNAIAREAVAVGAVPLCHKEDIRVEFNCFVADVEEEFRGVEHGISFTMESTDAPASVLEEGLQRRLLDALVACPHGVLAMSHVMDNLVQTSTNLASVRTGEASIDVVTSQRSSVGSGKDEAQAMVASVFELAGAAVQEAEGYPSWTPNPSSPLVSVACQSYHDLFHAEAQVLAIHAGLECGLFLDKKKTMDMISVGPTLRAVHSPDEAVDIASVEKFWEFILDLLKRM